MPRAFQAYPQNAVVTHSPANVTTGDPSSAIDAGKGVFKVPSLLDVCSGVTNGTRNPFMSGLNEMGSGANTSGVGGQTGNMLSGLQLFTDSLCGFAMGGTSASEVLAAARNLRAQGGDLHETIEAVRRLRDTVGAGTTPQGVLAGVEAVTGITNTNPVVQGAIATGQRTAGISGNQVIDAVNGAQSTADQSHQLLTGQTTTGVSGDDLLGAGGAAINQNTANHAAAQSLTTAQSVALKQQNLLVSQDFSSAHTVVGDTHWSWDGTDGAPSTNVLGCAKVTCNGGQQPMVSSEIPVVAGETIEVAAQVKWSGLFYRGASPIILGVEKYRLMKDPAGSGQNVYADIGWRDVFTVDSPGAASSGWTGIAGTYTVEPGVDQLRFRLDVAPNATGGAVKWDDAGFLKLDLIADEAVPGVGLTTDAIVTNLYGSAGSGFTHNQEAVALANTASALTSVTAKTNQISAEGGTGAVAGDDFNWTGDILSNANWDGGYLPGGSGGYVSNGAGVAWQPGVFGQEGLFHWAGTDSVSTTDYQLIQLVLSSGPSGTPFNYYSGVSLCGRINSGGTSYVVATMGSNGTYTVGYQTGGISGTFTALDSGSGVTVPGSASVVSLYCGDKTTTAPRHFRLEVGSLVISEFDEVGTGSPLGSGSRGWGWSAIAGGDQLEQAAPSAVNQWLALDQ